MDHINTFNNYAGVQTPRYVLATMNYTRTKQHHNPSKPDEHQVMNAYTSSLLPSSLQPYPSLPILFPFSSNHHVIGK